jgi:menaquinone-dependent protoporphyrinogen oxidase
MKIAIVYDSKYGVTEKIANTIAGKLTEGAALFSLKDNPNPDISGFEIVILGTPIYAGQASKIMIKYCKTNESVLLQKKIGLFVCGMEPDQEKREQELKNAYPSVLQEKATAAGFLGGAFLFEEMNFFERAIIKKIAKVSESVDGILQDEIDHFAEKINA